ncbi:MAG: hypothetical protein P4L49_20525 [Desulfosporosinus sp.]|nr:hypothetical protein [Desulfosporosinus sp.]
MLSTVFIYASIINNVIYGLASAKAMVLLADPTVFASSDEFDNEASREVERDVNYSNFGDFYHEFDQSQSQIVH